MPAIIYTAVWPLWIDGRLKSIMKNERFRILFTFKDFPPAALLDINGDNFKVEPIDVDEDIETIEADASISGEFKHLVEMMGGIGKSIRIIFSKKVKIKRWLKFYKFLKLFFSNKIDIEEHKKMEE